MIIICAASFNLSIPIVSQAHCLLLSGHVADIGERPIARLDAVSNRSILRRHAKRIKAHRVQDVIASHHAIAGNHVAD